MWCFTFFHWLSMRHTYLTTSIQKKQKHYGCLMSTMNENNRLLTCRHTCGLWPQELFAHCADSLPTEPDKAKLTLQFTGWPFSKPLVFFCCSILSVFLKTKRLIENKYHRTKLM